MNHKLTLTRARARLLLLQLQLVVSMRQKLRELDEMTELLDNEKKENECLGDQVNKLVKEICSSREYYKYSSFVREVENIIKLLLSLSGRLARVENALLVHEQGSPEKVSMSNGDEHDGLFTC